MSAHARRIKVIEFSLQPEGELEPVNFECQVQNWNLDPGISDGERHYTQCPGPGNSFIEETDPEATLELNFFSDWRSDGISDFLWKHSMKEADFTLSHHPDIVDEHVRWTGKVLLKAPSVGGEARAQEMTEVTLQIVGEPVYERVVVAP